MSKVLKGRMISLGELAYLLNVSDTTIRRQIKNGKIMAHKIGNQYAINPYQKKLVDLGILDVLYSVIHKK